MDRYCLFTLILYFALFGCICATSNTFGTISVEGPAFVNREVTLKSTPFYPWGCDVAWRYITADSIQFQTMTGAKVQRYSEYGSFFLKWNASSEYNGSYFYAECSTNKTIKTPMVSLNMKDILGQCGAVVLLLSIVLGADVKLGYFPSDLFIQRKAYTIRTWIKNMRGITLQEGVFEEEKVSEYLYILTIFNFEEGDEGTYSLHCFLSDDTDSVELHISERPSYPVLGPTSPDFITTECIYVYGGSDVYCNTENVTEPVQVFLLIGYHSVVLAKSKQNNGIYLFHNVHQLMDGLSRRNVTCRVSNAALETDYEVHGILCSVETGSLPVLTVPEFIYGESPTSICEVRNAIPAPIIEIRVDNVLLGDVQQTDTFNRSSHTYTSSAKVTKANKDWNGKKMCCSRKSKYDFDVQYVSICRNISMRYPPSDLLMSVNKNIENNNNFSRCFLNMSCETNESNPPCAIEWSSDNDSLRYVHSSNWANGGSGNYRSVSNVRYNVTNDMAGGTITCSTRCDYFTSNVNKKYKLSCSDIPLCLFMETSIVKESSPEILNLTCNTGGTCMPCAITWSTNFVFLHPISISQWTKNNGFGIISVSNALYFLTKDVDGKRIQCSANCGNDSSIIKHETYTILFQDIQEAAINPASVVAIHLHMTVLYAFSGTILLLLVTILTVLLFRRCKSQAYERFLRRRKPADGDPSSHVYDAVHSTVETMTLHNLRRISASAPENTTPLSVMEEHQVPSNGNVCHYDYVDTSYDQQNQGTNTQAENYIHAV